MAILMQERLWRGEKVYKPVALKMPNDEYEKGRKESDKESDKIKEGRQ